MTYQIRFKKIGKAKKFSIFKKKDPNAISLKKEYSFSEACEVYQNYVSTVEEDFDFEIALFNNIDSYLFELRSKGNMRLDTLIIDDIDTSLRDCDREEELILRDLQKQLFEIINQTNVSISHHEEREENELNEYFDEDDGYDYTDDELDEIDNNDRFEEIMQVNEYPVTEINNHQKIIKSNLPNEDNFVLPFEDYISLDEEVIQKGRSLLEKMQSRFKSLDTYLQEKISFNDFDEKLSEEKWSYLKSMVDPLKFEQIVSQVESEIDETTSHLTDQLERKYIECQMTESGIETAVQNKIKPLEANWLQESRQRISKEAERVKKENDASMISFKEKQTEALNAFIAKQKEELESFTARQNNQLNNRISELEEMEKTALEQKVLLETEKIRGTHIKNARSILLATKKKGYFRFNQALSDIQLKANNLEQAYITQLKEAVEQQTPMIQKKLDQLFEKQMVEGKLEIQNREIELKQKELELQKNNEEQSKETIAVLVENKEKEIQELKEAHQKEKEKELEQRLQMFDKQMNYMERINQTILSHSNLFGPKEVAELNEKKSEAGIDTNKQLSKVEIKSKKVNWKNTLFVCGAFLLGVIAMSIPVSMQGKSMETTVAQLEKKVSLQENGHSEKLSLLEQELAKEKEEKKKIHEQLQKVNQENSYEGLIQKESYIEAGKKYPEKVTEIENILFEKEKLPELKAFNELMPSEFGTLDIAILEKNYIHVTEIYSVLLNKDISPKRKQGVAFAYSQLGYQDKASWILR